MGKQKAANGIGSIRKKIVRKNGKEYIYWEARYTVGKDPSTGKQRQKSISGKTQREVREKMQRACVELDSGQYVEPTKMTVQCWIDSWLTGYTKNLKPQTQISYHTICDTHIIPALGAAYLQKLTPADVQHFLNVLQEEKHLSPKTIKNVHGVLHSALEQAVALHYLRDNPAKRCTLPKVQRSNRKGLDDEGIARFLAAIQGDIYENVFLLALFTGMRQGEILGLTWDCVDFENRTIQVRQQLQYKSNGSGQKEIISTKSGKARVITVARDVIGILGIQKLRSTSEYVFEKSDGQPLAATTVYKRFKKLAAAAGYPDLRFHDLRHCFAVVSLRAGDDVKTVQENLGHYSAAFTLDVYGYVTAQMREESAENIQQYIDRLERGK